MNPATLRITSVFAALLMLDQFAPVYTLAEHLHGLTRAAAYLIQPPAALLLVLGYYAAIATAVSRTAR